MTCRRRSRSETPTTMRILVGATVLTRTVAGHSDGVSSSCAEEDSSSLLLSESRIGPLALGKAPNTRLMDTSPMPLRTVLTLSLLIFIAVQFPALCKFWLDRPRSNEPKLWDLLPPP